MSGLNRTIVSTSSAPQPVAPYNQGVILDSTMYVSGVLGLDKDTMKIVEGDVTTETRQALRNLGYILQAGNSSYDKVVKSTIFLSDMNDFAAVNDVYREFFVKDFPARSAFQVAKLPLNARIEIEVIAATGQFLILLCSK
ncbi:hypothetical protein NQ315_004037 [Exocentrus adspersus]|uniref:Uncharacterized protein n=1 Tax=Exocentrus adspersus TaxID=1586481 RepID=A0AAV8W647_9CUCU|nr:hypothetical protein NQ315_004037 [Exocentrus adspersus]